MKGSSIRIFAGREKYGMWHKSVLSHESLSPRLRSWLIDVSRQIDGAIVLADIGCGNGTQSLPILSTLGKSGHRVLGYWVDSQLDAINASKVILSKYPFGLGTKVKLVNQKATELDLPHRAHCIVSLFLLHLLSPVEMKTALKRMFDNLQPGGSILISIPSIYDAKNVEFGPVKMRIHQIMTDTKEGSLYEPVLNPGTFVVPMYFFTENAVSKLLDEAGFYNIQIFWERNPEHPNGLGDEYKETITAIATRPNV